MRAEGRAVTPEPTFRRAADPLTDEDRSTAIVLERGRRAPKCGEVRTKMETNRRRHKLIPSSQESTVTGHAEALGELSAAETAPLALGGHEGGERLEPNFGVCHCPGSIGRRLSGGTLARMMTRTVPASFLLVVAAAACAAEKTQQPPAVERYEACAQQYGEGSERTTACVREIYCSEQWFMTDENLSDSTRSALRAGCLDVPDIAGAAQACREATGGDPSCDFDQPNYDPPPGYGS